MELSEHGGESFRESNNRDDFIRGDDIVFNTGVNITSMDSESYRLVPRSEPLTGGLSQTPSGLASRFGVGSLEGASPRRIPVSKRVFRGPGSLVAKKRAMNSLHTEPELEETVSEQGWKSREFLEGLKCCYAIKQRVTGEGKIIIFAASPLNFHGTC